MAIINEHIQDFTDVISILELLDGELESDTFVCDGWGRDSWHNLSEGRLGHEVKALLRKSKKCLLIVKHKMGLHATEQSTPTPSVERRVSNENS